MSYPFNFDFWTYVAPANECGLYFGPGLTPLKVVLAFSGINRGPAFGGADPIPPNREFLATHVPGTCIWNFNDAGYAGWWHLNPITVHVEGAAAGSSFFASPPPPVFAYSYDNSLNGAPGDHYQDGTVSILNALDDTLTTASEIATMLRFEKSDDANVQAWGLPAGEIVLRFDRRSDHSNLKIKQNGT